MVERRWAIDVVVSFALRMAPRELVESIQYEDIERKDS